MIQLSVEELRELVLRTTVHGEPLRLQECKTHSFETGKAYLIRTVTMHYTGRVLAVTNSDVVLEDAAWIAYTGRFADSLQTGELSEIEPYPGRVAVCRGAMVDFCEWPHKLPKVQK